MSGFLTAHFLALLLNPFWIQLVKRNLSGQAIREQGPASHKTKEGTPTTGGLVIFLSFFLSLLLFSLLSFHTFMLLFSFFSFSYLGLLDDWMNIHKTKALGLPARYKILLQVLLAAFLSFYLLRAGFNNIALPFSRRWIPLPLPLAFFFFILVIVATVNSANLSDGLDGLATGIFVLLFLLLALLSASLSESHVLTPPLLILSGACTGFLWLNFYPARIFLGNAGAMGLGAVLATAAILAGAVLYLPLLAFVLVLESLSVIIQVLYFRRTGKRIFKMSPLHHHFELQGQHEASITVRFWLLTLLTASLTLLL